MKLREEQDSLGVVHVPVDAYYGAQTARAEENFRISDLRFPRIFIKALGLIKKHAAMANKHLGLLDEQKADAITKAAQEVIDGRLDDHFVVDIFQTGSGTSTNMNANEVIAGRANEMLTGKRGGKSPVHPNDHVNLGQSSNDVIPSAIHIAASLLVYNDLIPTLERLLSSVKAKMKQFQGIRKIGRTHLQDAVPITLGQEFSGYVAQIEQGISHISDTAKGLLELALGGTAVGTGINTHPEFSSIAIKGISQETGIKFAETKNHFAAQASMDPAIKLSGALRALAVSLTKICNDLRWMSSGPRCGIGEITLPPLQPGSSIMPGKINPVIPEAVLQVCAQVVGNDLTICVAGQSGNFELNVMLPVIAYNLLESIDLLKNASQHLAQKCIDGIYANERHCYDELERSLALATIFVPHIGYDRASQLAKEAFENNKSIRQIAIEKKILPEKEINELIDTAIGQEET